MNNNTLTPYQAVYDVVRRIPEGKVTSYGRIAKMVNCSARQVGYAMAATPGGDDIPWHRVINSKGEVSVRKQGDGDHGQRKRLLAEGVVFDEKGRVCFDRFGWAEAEIPLMPEDRPGDWPDSDMARRINPDKKPW